MTRREEIRRVTTLIGNLCRATQNAADSAISFSESDDEIALMVKKCSRGGTITLGAIEKIGPKEMETIYKMAL